MGVPSAPIPWRRWQSSSQSPDPGHKDRTRLPLFIAFLFRGFSFTSHWSRSHFSHFNPRAPSGSIHPGADGGGGIPIPEVAERNSFRACGHPTRVHTNPSRAQASFPKIRSFPEIFPTLPLCAPSVLFPVGKPGEAPWVLLQGWVWCLTEAAVPLGWFFWESVPMVGLERGRFSRSGSAGWAFQGCPSPCPSITFCRPWSFQESPPEAANPRRIRGDIPDIPSIQLCVGRGSLATEPTPSVPRTSWNSFRFGVFFFMFHLQFPRDLWDQDQLPSRIFTRRSLGSSHGIPSPWLPHPNTTSTTLPPGRAFPGSRSFPFSSSAGGTCLGFGGIFPRIPMENMQ